MEWRDKQSQPSKELEESALSHELSKVGQEVAPRLNRHWYHQEAVQQAYSIYSIRPMAMVAAEGELLKLPEEWGDLRCESINSINIQGIVFTS